MFSGDRGSTNLKSCLVKRISFHQTGKANAKKVKREKEETQINILKQIEHLLISRNSSNVDVPCKVEADFQSGDSIVK